MFLCCSEIDMQEGTVIKLCTKFTEGTHADEMTSSFIVSSFNYFYFHSRFFLVSFLSLSFLFHFPAHKPSVRAHERKRSLGSVSQRGVRGLCPNKTENFSSLSFSQFLVLLSLLPESYCFVIIFHIQ